jgi:hypothetical protein
MIHLNIIEISGYIAIMTIICTDADYKFGDMILRLF